MPALNIKHLVATASLTFSLLTCASAIASDALATFNPRDNSTALPHLLAGLHTLSTLLLDSTPTLKTALGGSGRGIRGASKARGGIHGASKSHGGIRGARKSSFSGGRSIVSESRPSSGGRLRYSNHSAGYAFKMKRR